MPDKLTDLTPRQQTALAYIARRGGPVHGDLLSAELDSSVQGAHATAASLVKHGLIHRRVITYDGVRGVHYGVSSAGEALLKST